MSRNIFIWYFRILSVCGLVLVYWAVSERGLFSLEYLVSAVMTATCIFFGMEKTTKRE